VNVLLDLDLAVMRRRDMKSVLAIEARVFPEPWSAAIFASELALRHGRSYKVVRDNRRIVGYRGLMFVGEEAHVTTIAVAPEYQGHGVATLLLIDAVRTSLDEGARHLSLEVATGNERAQALYRRFGFMPVGIRKNYYPVTGEDAYVMWAYDLNSPAYTERLAEIERWLAERA
jgi:[ribosomal protein S18]-alanine N-acetyltransferase